MVGWLVYLLVGLFDDIDYSILEDESADSTMEDMVTNGRKAIQIEFKVEDYEDTFAPEVDLEFNEDVFKGNYYLTYVDQQGQLQSIMAMLQDLDKRSETLQEC